MLQSYPNAPRWQIGVGQITCRSLDSALVHLDAARRGVQYRTGLIQAEMTVEADAEQRQIETAARFDEHIVFAAHAVEIGGGSINPMEAFLGQVALINEIAPKHVSATT